MLRNSGDESANRCLLKGEMINDNPNICFNKLLANSTTNNDQLRFYFDGANFYAIGRKAGADTVTKKLGDTGGGACYLLGSFGTNVTKTFNVSSISGYTSFTEDNFLLGVTTVKTYLTGPRLSASKNITKSYNASTGILTIKSPQCVTNTYTCGCNIDFAARLDNLVGYVWLFTGTIMSI